MERPRRIVEFEQLNALGKTVFVAGMAAHAGKGLLKRLIRHVARIAVESKRAFEQGMNPDIEEARVLEEKPSARPSEKRDAPEAP
ncbi:hypothetical protein [Rhodothermus marinus]|uniref:Uncharacterized protein n=1 Tax=Rhodothermus marinus (strain ATCC 43812 / DSM 4252 / R-10) TaxID=518766 RepID=D0MJC8_RHOM4|nr:hypothetical protein [Rhodothermus marinus]ACY48586.1 hypothetical protein Rmar_1700 [Rhodothermus marinus DSM 4252]AEN73015.1 hypothetical protein Rhom172_1086 [Rhodothermus marinus SG0.5JP17-172]MBO2492250.1 hypothetical protein [Rhodothermus marinus]